jgi:hypothetical protein
MKVHGVQSETLRLLRERNYQRRNFCLSDFAKGIKQVSMIGIQIMHEQTIDNREQRTDFAKTFASKMEGDRGYFKNLIIGSDDFNPADSFIWGYLKERVYSDPVPKTMDQLKTVS